jgi:hypothetical protein
LGAIKAAVDRAPLRQQSTSPKQEVGEKNHPVKQARGNYTGGEVIYRATGQATRYSKAIVPRGTQVQARGASFRENNPVQRSRKTDKQAVATATSQLASKKKRNKDVLDFKGLFMVHIAIS